MTRPALGQRWSILPFVGAVWVYRLTLGPWLGGHCRFYPTCSQYALDAYRLHGPGRGSYLTAMRLCRCHPFGGEGFDPVPEPKSAKKTPAPQK